MGNHHHFMSDQPGPAVVLGMAWHDGEPLIRIRRLDDDNSKLFKLVGSILRYEATNARHCVGFGVRNSSSYQDCHNPTQRNERTCVSCSVAEANHASGLHHAHTKQETGSDPAMAAHLQQPNSLYLAMFRDGSLKVGTTTSRRHDTRLLEQGAWIASVVATTVDGIEIRKIEDLVTEQLGIPQSVSVKRKLTGMTTPSDEEALTAKLVQAANDVADLLELHSDNLSESTEVIAGGEIWRFTNTLTPPFDNDVAVHLTGSPFVYSARLDQDQHHIEIVGCCGRIALITKPDSSDYFLVDLGQLFGIELTIGDHKPAAITVQDSLF